MKSIGLDIGTTTICGVVVEGTDGKVLDTITLANDSAMEGPEEFSRLQNPARIREICEKIVGQFLEKNGEIAALGVTGQMHGILYLNKEGEPVSPLYSWQDGRGNEKFDETHTYSEKLTEITGYPMATGFGLTTHYYLQEKGQVPEDAAVLCTIPDYITMCFAGIKRPVMHGSMAASIGLFDGKEGVWDEKALACAGIRKDVLPEISGEKGSLCRGTGGFFVAPALGDNQASFLGAAGGECDILLNVGTGSQISIRTKEYEKRADIEYRPFVGGQYLMVGAPLCGGASYALLKNFFRKTLELFGCEVPKNMYDIMNRAAAGQHGRKDLPEADTRFNGTRKDPEQRGSISGLSTVNFDPACMTLAVLKGICHELYGTYEKASDEIKASRVMAGSGNGIRQNPVLQREARELFGKDLAIPLYSEEASYGTALFALFCRGDIERLEDIGNLIQTESVTA